MSSPWVAPPRSAEEIASSYDTSIVVRRWGATLVDFVVLGASGVAILALPESLQLPALLTVALLALLYYPVLEWRFGATPGKLVCRVRVVGAGGLRPTLGQAVIRTFLRILEVNPAVMGGIPAGIAVLVSKKRQRLGDMAAGTFVLRSEDVAYLGQMRDHEQATAAFHAGLVPALAPPPPPPELPASPGSASWLFPTNRSGWAIAAGYLGLFSALLVPAPFALAAGVLGLLQIRRQPALGGKGRAIFGIVSGAVCSILFLAAVVVPLFTR